MISLDQKLYQWHIQGHTVCQQIILLAVHIQYTEINVVTLGFPGSSVVKNLPANAGDAGLISDQEDPLEKEITTHSVFMGNTMERGAWQTTVHGVTEKSDMT